MIDNTCPVPSRGSRNCIKCCSESECAGKLRIPKLGFTRAKLDAEHCAIAHLKYPQEYVCPTWGCEQCICGVPNRKELEQFLKEIEKLK